MFSVVRGRTVFTASGAEICAVACAEAWRGSGEVLTRAHTVQVAVESATGELSFASPAALIAAVRRHL